ncbi:MAG: DUF3313 domain-containing protein [Burkholderiales bacterium]|nr:DUF3313 domain-containing protein [Burkholderiales bacterium]
MYKKIIISCIALFLIAISIIGCSSTKEPSEKSPGFLPDYSLLKPIKSDDKDVKGYYYRNPNIERSNYTAAMIAPVILYQPPGVESSVKISEAQIEAARLSIESGIKQTVSRKIALTNKPGKGVAKVSVAITGAILEGDGFRPRYLLPISAIIQLTSVAVGLNNKKPVLVIETKVTDSQTNQLISASMTTISGDKFRTEASTPGEFQKLANTWVAKSMAYSAEH